MKGAYAPSTVGTDDPKVSKVLHVTKKVSVSHIQILLIGCFYTCTRGRIICLDELGQTFVIHLVLHL